MGFIELRFFRWCMGRSGDDSGESTQSDARESSDSPHQKYTDREFLDYLASLSNPPVAGTTEVADAVGCTPETAFKRLSKLRDEGIVGGKLLGNDIAWYLESDRFE